MALTVLAAYSEARLTAQGSAIARKARQSHCRGGGTQRDDAIIPVPWNPATVAYQYRGIPLRWQTSTVEVPWNPATVA